MKSFILISISTIDPLKLAFNYKGIISMSKVVFFPLSSVIKMYIFPRSAFLIIYPACKLTNEDIIRNLDVYRDS